MTWSNGQRRRFLPGCLRGFQGAVYDRLLSARREKLVSVGLESVQYDAELTNSEPGRKECFAQRTSRREK